MTPFGYLRKEANRTLQLLQSSVSVYKGFRIFSRNESSFVPKRVLILAKVSRYYFEKLRESNLEESQLRLKMLEKGSDYDALLASHRANKMLERNLTEVLKKLNIEYKVMDRLNIDQLGFEWADLILPIGGDGTFLLASNLIQNNKKPIMGINTDPTSSEGFLMLPQKYSHNIAEIFELLKAGEFSYLMRSRIRVTVKGDEIWSPPFHMHEKCQVVGEGRCKSIYTDKDTVTENNYINWFHANHNFQVDPTIKLSKERVLPWLALNEVFIGECLSARTSSLQINVNDENKFHKIKSSGLCVSTGTGSTSWHRTINSLSPQSVEAILNIADSGKNYSKEQINDICIKFNKSLQFSADDRRLNYTIRDIILNDIWPIPKNIQPRDFCNRLTVWSQCFDAGLVLDGGVAVPFNNGTMAVLEIYPEDALRTIVLQ